MPDFPPPSDDSRPPRERSRHRRPPSENRRPRRDDRPREDRPRHGGEGQRRQDGRHRRDDRRQPRHRRDDRRHDGPRERREPRPGRQSAPPPPSFFRRLLGWLTFGLLSPKAAAPAPRAARPTPAPQPATSETLRPPRRQEAAPPPLDVDAIETPRLHVGNLSYDATEGDLFELFNGFGKVQNVEIAWHRETHRSKGFGFVLMFSLADARRAAAELHGKPFMGRTLTIGPARSRGPSEPEPA